MKIELSYRSQIHKLTFPGFSIIIRFIFTCVRRCLVDEMENNEYLLIYKNIFNIQKLFDIP